jgi:hypothetical protein
LLHELTGLKLLVGSLPTHECSHHGLEVVVAHQGNGKLLSTHVVTEKGLPLHSQVVDGIIHSRKTGFSSTNEVLISDNFVNQLLFGQLLESLLGISILILPAVEQSSTRMTHQIEHELGLLLSVLACLNPVFPLVESLGHDLELTVGEEETNDTLLHIVFLSGSLFVKVIFNFLRRVTTLDQVVSHSLSLSHLVIPEEHDVTLSVDSLCNFLTLGELHPLHIVVTESVARGMLKHSS